MIRSALIALGLSAGAVSAQSVVPTSNVVGSCGGTRFILEAVLNEATPDELERASDVVSARLGAMYGAAFNYTSVAGEQIILDLPDGLGATEDAIAPLMETTALGFYGVVAEISYNMQPELEAGQIVLPNAEMPDFSFILSTPPVVDQSDLRSAELSFDQNNRPAMAFSLERAAARVFGQYTEDNIGNMFAIVIDGQVHSAPIIQSGIWGGQGIITGMMTEQDVTLLAAKLQGGVMPIDLHMSRGIPVDGSDPSADFCP